MQSNVSIRLTLDRLVPRIVTAGFGFMLMLSTSAWAVRGEVPDGVTDQLEQVRAVLTGMQEQLDEMQNGIGENASDLDALETEIGAQMDLIDISNNDVFEAVNSAEVTTKLCFDTSAAMGLKLGGVGEFGASWTKVLHVEAAFELDEFWNLDMGVGSEVCIQVPLYSAYLPEHEVSQDEGEKLDLLTEGFSSLGRANAFVVGSVSEQILPPAQSVRDVLQAVEDALTSTDPAAARKLLSPATYTPMTPPLLTTMINTAAVLVLDAVIDPCGAIESSPLFAGIPADTYNWMCFMEPNATMQILKVIADVADLLLGWL